MAKSRVATAPSALKCSPQAGEDVKKAAMISASHRMFFGCGIDRPSSMSKSLRWGGLELPKEKETGADLESTPV